MKKFLKDFIVKPSLNKVLSTMLLLGIMFSFVSILLAAAPDPGHNFTESSGGITTGQIIYGSAADTFSALSDVAAGSYLRSGGVATAPLWSTLTLPNAATTGDLVIASGTNALGSLADVATGSFLKSGGVGVAPAWKSFARYNQSVSTPAAGFAADTYLVGSSITVAGLQAGSRYHLIFQASKTAAGVATPILNIRFGTGGAVGDASKCTLTFTAQTAATDTGTFEVWTTFRTVGSGTSAVLQCVGQRRHGASITGFGTLVGETQAATSAGFDSTVANSIIGISVNGGASAAWTITLVQAELENLN